MPRPLFPTYLPALGREEVECFQERIQFKLWAFSVEQHAFVAPALYAHFVQGETRPYTFASLQPGTTYDVKVKATNHAGT